MASESPQNASLRHKVEENRHHHDEPARIVVAGSLAIDLSCDFMSQGKAAVQPQLQTSNPALIRQSLGGVGQNIASAVHYMGSSVRLCSVVANDPLGLATLDMLSRKGLQTSGIEKKQGLHTAQYVTFNDGEKNLVLAMADMNILEEPTPNFSAVWKRHLDSCKPKWLVLDANWDPATLHNWLHAARASTSKVGFEPVSVAKASRLFRGVDPMLGIVPDHHVSLATPNVLELAAMHQAANDNGMFEHEDWWHVINSIGLSNSGSRDKLVALTRSILVDQGVPQQSIRLLPFIPCILTTLGKDGVLLAQLLQPGDARLTSPASAPYILSRSTDSNYSIGGVYMRYFPPAEVLRPDDVVSVNGVGDTFLGVLIAGLAKDKPKEIPELIGIAQRASVMTLKSKEAVSPSISSLRALL